MQQYLEYSNVVSPHSHFWGYSKHLSPQMDPKKQQTLSTNLENFWNSDYAFILLKPQSVAKPCSSSAWDETIPIEFKMAKVVKTNTTFGTILSNIIFKINLQKMKDVSSRSSTKDIDFWKPYLSLMDEVWNKSCLLGCNQRSAQIIYCSPTYKNLKLITQFTHQRNNFFCIRQRWNNFEELSVQLKKQGDWKTKKWVELELKICHSHSSEDMHFWLFYSNIRQWICTFYYRIINKHGFQIHMKLRSKVNNVYV